MNEYLYNYLATQGFTQLALRDRVVAYLKAEIVLAGGTPRADATEEDLWKQLGALLGALSTTVNKIQMEWCASKGATGTTWNDLMRNLP